MLVDPGDEPGTLLSAIAGTRVAFILLTHGHPDHSGALAELHQATGAPVAVHGADAAQLPLSPDRLLEDGQVLHLGRCRLKVHHLPGHTPGSVGLQLSGRRWLVGDSVFPGGPGHTDSPAAFATLIICWEGSTSNRSRTRRGSAPCSRKTLSAQTRSSTWGECVERHTL